MSSFKKTSQASIILVLVILIECSSGANKYSEKANKPKAKTDFSPPQNIKALRELDKPFRMHKINLVWVKAVHRLTDPKLQSLFSDLKIQDKEELAYKHAKSDGKDETGLEEARLRKKLLDIMKRYDLLEHFEDVEDAKAWKKPKPFKDDSKNYIVKDVFRDKRLNKLWAKAERGGFNREELKALKEEFEHQQDKIDEYMSLLADVESGDPDKHENSLHEKPESWNELEGEEEISNDVPGKKKDYLGKANLLKTKHLEVRSGYDHFEGVVGQGPGHKEFVDPKVQDLWRLATEAKFSRDELASLKEELFHYEKKLLKLRHLHTNAAIEAVERGKDEPRGSDTHIKKHARDVEKLHKDIEEKILLKHSEL